MTILVFDSGIGGLTVLREARVLMPHEHYVYVADNEAFPYGDWEEDGLKARMVTLFGDLIKRWHPDICILACNTASTLAIHVLREAYPDQVFVGTVPAIKPAAERTRSGMVSVLATPGTVKRQYTRNLIDQYASKCDVTLVSSTGLAALAETYLRGGFTDENEVAREIAPCFVEKNGKNTDIVVLACTHYPFLANRMRKMAPWPVDWIDTSEAIARRAFSLWEEMDCGDTSHSKPDLAQFTAGKTDEVTASLLIGFGLSLAEPGHGTTGD
ncbi:MAG: glutamate racemase [Rhizobiaceae bacterium]